MYLPEISGPHTYCLQRVTHILLNVFPCRGQCGARPRVSETHGTFADSVAICVDIGVCVCSWFSSSLASSVAVFKGRTEGFPIYGLGYDVPDRSSTQMRFRLWKWEGYYTFPLPNLSSLMVLLRGIGDSAFWMVIWLDVLVNAVGFGCICVLKNLGESLVSW